MVRARAYPAEALFDLGTHRRSSCPWKGGGGGRAP